MNITNVSATELNEQQTELFNNENLKQKDLHANFKAELEMLLAQNNIDLNGAEENLLLNTAQETGDINLDKSKILSWAKDLKEIKSSFNYDTMTMDKDDAVFFANLTQNIPAQVSITNNEVSVNLADINEIEDVQKTIQTSKTLTNIIENCYKTQQSARIDFDNNISVIMKIDRKGKISAEFIPSDKVAEQYLKNNIAFLKQTFDEQNLPYNELSYRQQNKNNRNNNKGKKDE